MPLKKITRCAFLPFLALVTGLAPASGLSPARGAICQADDVQVLPFNEGTSNPITTRPRFTALDRSETGIEFVSRLVPDHPNAYLYHSGMTCSGLAAGDIDGDGRPDLFLASGPGPNALYLQNGASLHFNEVTAGAGEGLDGGDDWAAGVAFADVDNDGDLDIYLCNYDAPNRLYINQGPGEGQPVRFVESAAAAGLDVTDASHMPAFCDYDNDGDLDMYLLTNALHDPRGGLGEMPVEFERPGVPKLLPGYEEYYHIWVVDFDHWGVEEVGRDDLLFRNDGVDVDGQVHFTDVTSVAGIAGRGDGLSCTWWDADLDGDCDLYVCNDFLSNDCFYINNGDGTFTNRVAEAMPHTTWFSMGSNFGDIDNDGDFDLFVADMAATSHYKSKVTMGIMGGETMQRANESMPSQYMRNALYLNEAGLRFREASYLSGLSSSDWTWSVKMNDFDADGRLDVYLTNGVPREMNHSDLKITREQLVGKHLWEFYKDGPMRKEKNLVWHNNGDLNFTDVSAAWGLDHNGASYGAVTADFDLDGDLDLVVMNLEENVSVYRNDGPVGGQLSVQLLGTTANRNGVGAVVEVSAGNQRWIQQLMPGTGYHSYDEPVLHFGLGDVQQIDRLQVHWPGGGVQTLTDIPINRRVQIRQSSATSAESRPQPIATLFAESKALEDLWHQENAYDDFSLQPLLPHRLSAEGPCMVWGDVNRDGNPDVYIGGSAGNAGELRRGLGDGKFELTDNPVFFEHAAGEDSAAVLGDFDDDGDLDLLVGRGSYEFAEGDPNQINLLYLNDGSGRFRVADADTLPATATNTGTLAAADFDQDGDLDVFLGARVKHREYPLSTASALWLNEQGTFADVTEKLAPALVDAGLVTDAVWADMNGDGWQDLIVSREWGTVAIYENVDGRLVLQTDAGELSERTGWWSAIAAGDIDADGDIDLLAGNLGKNTKYKTSLTKPMTVYYGQFDESGVSHIVEVKQEGAVCYPERGRSCSSNAMPFIAEKYETFHKFGMATLDDIYGEDKLKAAKKFEANTFENGFFINDGSGKFKFQALPKIAQIAPSHAVGLADLDGDSDLDAVLGQNFFGPQSETGHYDGGLGQILANDGAGRFELISPDRSGFMVREAATAIRVFDLNQDGKLDIAVGTNDGPVRLFIRQ